MRRGGCGALESAQGGGAGGHEGHAYNCGMELHVDRKRSRGEEKKREASPKPLNINEETAWRCGDPGVRASKPRQ